MFGFELDEMVQVTITKEDLESYRIDRQEYLKKAIVGDGCFNFCKQSQIGHMCAFQKAAKRAFPKECDINVTLSQIYSGEGEGSVLGRVNQQEQMFWDRVIGQCDKYASDDEPKNLEAISDLLPATVNIVLTNQD